MSETEPKSIIDDIDDLISECKKLYKMIDMYRKLINSYEEQIKLLKEQNIILKKRCGLE